MSSIISQRRPPFLSISIPLISLERLPATTSPCPLGAGHSGNGPEGPAESRAAGWNVVPTDRVARPSAARTEVLVPETPRAPRNAGSSFFLSTKHLPLSELSNRPNFTTTEIMKSSPKTTFGGVTTPFPVSALISSHFFSSR